MPAEQASCPGTRRENQAQLAPPVPCRRFPSVVTCLCLKDRDNNKNDINDACSDSDETTIVESTKDIDDHIYHESSDDEAWSEDSDMDSQDVE
ncbi:hypothetical protein Pmani_023321 [Petrolisthes manimaculis]|uniref:Uncharacterized protein n=1 Tax=Petrolisthes manimaculis TaxID=1843537 RepID=A0AAE1U3D7_9EUCA|nr:hypothetical protein Pmani_023321 [Petrolisthes manimaculis]